MTTTMEFELHAHDPLNPGFGFKLDVTANGGVIQSEDLTDRQAAFVLGRLLLAVNEARDFAPETAQGAGDQLEARFTLTAEAAAIAGQPSRFRREGR